MGTPESAYEVASNSSTEAVYVAGEKDCRMPRLISIMTSCGRGEPGRILLIRLSYESFDIVPGAGLLSLPEQAWKLPAVYAVLSSVLRLVAILAKVWLPEGSTLTKVPSCGR